MPATAEFRLSVTRALSDQLAEALSRLTPMPLTVDNIHTLEERGGVYQLYYKGGLVYIGKADRSLLDRVSMHRRKLSGRLNLSPGEISCTAMYVDEDLSAVAPEALLIARHRDEGGAPWNFNGFGNNDPGRERDTSKVALTHFDTQYPANLEYVVPIPVGSYAVGDLLMRLKSALPYVFRYQDARKRPSDQPPDYWHNFLMVEAEELTARRLFERLAESLPGWQITALPGYVVMYKESRDYPAARQVFASTAGGA